MQYIEIILIEAKFKTIYEILAKNFKKNVHMIIISCHISDLKKITNKNHLHVFIYKSLKRQ